MKLARISKIKWSVNFGDLNFDYLGPKFSIDTLLTFLTPEKEEYFIRLEIRQ